MDTPTGSHDELQLPPGFERDPEGTCTVVLTLNDEGGGKMKLQLGQSYDTTFNKISPITPPQSSLEMRQIMQHTLRDGRRVCFAPGLVAVLEEDDPNA